MLKKIISGPAIIIVGLFIISNNLKAQQDTLLREVSASGGIIYSSNSKYYHSATLGELLTDRSDNNQYSIISGFWSADIIIPTEIDWQVSKQLPKTFEMQQNYPNPFNPTTTIEYELPKESIVNIEIFDITGQRVKRLIDSRTQRPGYMKIEWDGTNENGKRVGSGAYFVIINIFENDNKLDKQNSVYRKVRKMLLVK